MSSHAPDRARTLPSRTAFGFGAPAAAADGEAARTPSRDSPDSPRRPGSGSARREPLWRHIVGDVLRCERRSQRRTLQDVASAARISTPYLSEIERGRKEPSSEVLAAVARALGLSLADLLALSLTEVAEAAVAGPPRFAGRTMSPHAMLRVAA
jgi:ribosome-binding protein aMBF1 (putative translation factor)